MCYKTISDLLAPLVNLKQQTKICVPCIVANKNASLYYMSCLVNTTLKLAKAMIICLDYLQIPNLFC